MKNKLLVIIPLHQFDNDVKTLLEDAIKSVPSDVDISLSIPKSIKKNIEDGMDLPKNLTLAVNENDEKSFTELVNSAVNENYDWFSILEYDDEYTPIWFDTLYK